ncbi:hypothetical protein [Egbenema bharatensis]|uniref:hypothetical protein n=1 Tax=Egbenema bharatensis TaxID=3463334 RepID=UPI003A89A6F2
MDSEDRQCYPTAPNTSSTANSTSVTNVRADQSAQSLNLSQSPANPTAYPATLEDSDPEVILNCIRSGIIWAVNSRRKNGLILYKRFYAEFAEPGAAVGGEYDRDCQRVIPVGNLSLLQPETHESRQNAYLIRRQWIKLTQQFTDQSAPLQRAQMILNQFETYFDQPTIARIPDEAFAMLVGVFPYAVRIARRPPGKTSIKVKT